MKHFPSVTTELPTSLLKVTSGDCPENAVRRAATQHIISFLTATPHQVARPAVLHVFPKRLLLSPALDGTHAPHRHHLGLGLSPASLPGPLHPAHLCPVLTAHFHVTVSLLEGVNRAAESKSGIASGAWSATY